MISTGSLLRRQPEPILGLDVSSCSVKLLSTRGSAIAETRTNQVFVTDVSSRLEAVQQLIAKIDVPVRQVLIEARIVEASETFGKSLGVRLGGGSGIIVAPAGGVGVQFGPTYVDGSNSTTSNSFLNLPAIGQGGLNPATFAVSIFSDNGRFLNLEISALEAEARARWFQARAWSRPTRPRP